MESLRTDEKEEIQKTNILDWFIQNAERYDNIRILKTKLENAIFEKLTETFVIGKTWNGIIKVESQNSPNL